MRIIIFGAGAIGGLFGAHLNGAHDVTLVCREGIASAINENGLTITGLSDIHATPRAVSSAEGLEHPDILILTVKAYDTETAITEAKPLVGPNTKILSLQNGLGNLETISRIVPETDIIGGITSQGAILRAPGLIEHTGKSYTYVNDENIARVLSESGIEAQYSKDIQAEIWYKAIVNCVINPLGTLMKDRNGLLVRDSRFEPLARQIVGEGIEVADAKGIALDFDIAWQKVMQVVTETAENICSMRLDVERGRRTEIEQMNGAIARYGTELGIPTPVNSLLTALIKSA